MSDMAPNSKPAGKRICWECVGEFCSVDEADAVIADCRTFVAGLVVLCHPDFKLNEHKFEQEI
ncbi:hypothetical protein LBW59_25375 [Ralstonia solanacearum]|jgi:hypothetical protein|uniref:Uncharacterized protein n=1 Tax=Ralstonia solanacearum TaxID=305 RepID=A0AAW5ZVB7_RALSL|nr:hypothetical protein [Ralstonia solanacearum]MDB0574059.1 hypothetical protein [Ralstonia solanacearum]